MCPESQFSLGAGRGGRTWPRATRGLQPSSARRASEGRRVWGSRPKHFHPQRVLARVTQELSAACCPLGWALTTRFSPPAPAPTLGFFQTEPGNLETQNQRLGGGPRAWVPIRDGMLPSLPPMPTWAWPPPTWKATLARCTGMLRELPVGMGARGEGKIWGQSCGLCSQNTRRRG